MPPLVGRSDDKCSRTSRKSHFRPTNVVLDMDGTSKNRGLSGQFSLLKAGKIKKGEKNEKLDVLLDLFFTTSFLLKDYGAHHVTKVFVSYFFFLLCSPFMTSFEGLSEHTISVFQLVVSWFFFSIFDQVKTS